MTVTNGYATLAEFKLYASTRGQTASTDANDDSVIEDIIETASRWIDGQTARRFWKNGTDETRYFSPTDSDRFECGDLAATPTTLSVDYSGGGRTYTDLTASDYELEPVNAALDGLPYTEIYIAPSSSEFFPTIRRGVQVVGKFGFPSVPDDVKELTLAITHNIYQSRSGQSSQGNITVTASGVVIRPQDVPAWGAAIITKYRIYR